MRLLRSTFLIAFVALITSGCANPLNQATSNRYSNTCVQAEQSGRLDVAEEACYRALVNVDWGNLGESQKSQKMYNFARIKRKLHKFDEAEKLLKESIEIEEKQPQQSREKIGRRLAELAMTYGQKKQYQTGLPYVKQLYAIADSFQGDEKKTVSIIFYAYSQKSGGAVSAELSEKYSMKAIEMGFNENMLK